MDVIIHNRKVPQFEGKPLFRLRDEVQKALFESVCPQSRVVVVDFRGNVICCAFHKYA
jgi:hypothetical protein